MIEATDLRIQQGDFALQGVSFSVPLGDYLVLMGRSGCGKTTIMEAICGLRSVASGTITLDGIDVTRSRPGERNIGYVPQDGALFPTMKVYEQLAFGLRLRHATPQEIDRRVQQLSELLGIASLLDRTPHGLSGGEAQRVSIGRALAMRPAILCLDEPLSSLDESTKLDMRKLLADLHAETKITTLHITHDRREADALADSILILEHGQLRKA